MSQSKREEDYLMSTRTVIVICAGIMFGTIMGYVPGSSAEVNINIGIGVPLPHVVIHAPPSVVVIPGTYVYFAADVDMEIFFYHGYWYRPHHGRWYRARGYNGPWNNIRSAGVPDVLLDLPPDFRRHVQHRDRIRHVDLEKNWQTWERDKHWDNRDDKHEVRNVRDDREWESNHNGRGGKEKRKR